MKYFEIAAGVLGLAAFMYAVAFLMFVFGGAQ